MTIFESDEKLTSNTRMAQTHQICTPLTIFDFGQNFLVHAEIILRKNFLLKMMQCVHHSGEHS